MCFKHSYIISLIISPLIVQICAADWDSPCPKLFVYEPQGKEPDKWYGIVKILSDTELQGFQLRVILDRPALELGVSMQTLKDKLLN